MGHKVKMVQVSKHRWNLVAPKGHVMVEGLYLESPFKASEWCAAYISTFQSWSFELILKQEDL
jgi:hypothetical protein